MPRAKHPLEEADPNAETPPPKSSKRKTKQKQPQSPDVAGEEQPPDVAAVEISKSQTRVILLLRKLPRMMKRAE